MFPLDSLEALLSDGALDLETSCEPSRCSARSAPSRLTACDFGNDRPGRQDRPVRDGDYASRIHQVGFLEWSSAAQR